MFMWEEPNECHHKFVCDYNRNVHKNPTMMSYSASSYPTTLGYIQHPISKLDTLAGIAIKYGVEVADVKKMNGLVTDRQMFALKTLYIPLAGSHPQSLCLPNGSSTSGHCNSDHSPADHACRELFEPFQSMRTKSSEQQLSPAMNSLQGCYGTKPTVKKSISGVFETAVYKNGSSNSSENGSFYRNSVMSDRPLSHQKSRSLVDEILDDIMGSSNILPVVEAREGDSDKWNDTPELLLGQDNSSSAWFSSITGKGLAQRQKAASRTALTTESESESNGFMGMGHAVPTDRLSGIRKSSSTSVLQDNNGSIRSTSRWSLRPDLQASSTATIGKPIFDALSKPVTGRRNKAAID